MTCDTARANRRNYRIDSRHHGSKCTGFAAITLVVTVLWTWLLLLSTGSIGRCRLSGASLQREWQSLNEGKRL
jgi:hypothetical protein